VLSETDIGRFQTYLDTLLLWRSRLSLTTARTALEIVRAHVVDSLAVAPFVKPGFRVADLGSGAGFPGLPLAIVCPESAVRLIEAKRKKANFLREVVRRAQLANVEIIEERAEHLAGNHLGAYDIAVSRAVWPLGPFLGICERLLRSGGLAIAMKGPKTLEEAGGPGFSFSRGETVKYKLPSGIHRVLFVYRRDGNTRHAE
jgi:16S rRNA (guanine527-N7)-methyltransferase